VALAGVAMCAILYTTVRLQRQFSRTNIALSGISWGIAIGTKFTFAPLYIVFLVSIGIAFRGSVFPTSSRILHSAGGIGKWLFVPFSSLFIHTSCAYLVLCSLYLIQRIGTPLGEHGFSSHLFLSVVGSVQQTSTNSPYDANWISRIPSPFPMAFLQGIDQQLADMDSPRGAYLLGSRVEGRIDWFFAVGYIAKEQLAVWFAIALAMFATVVRWKRGMVLPLPQRDQCIFCLSMMIGFALFMSTQQNLVWNVRYLIPILPVIYLIVSSCLSNHRELSFSPIRKWPPGWAFPSICFLVIIEYLMVWPWHFSYINPMFGGSYRTPIVLNDSNFDYGQDLFYAGDWVKSISSHESAPSHKFYGLFSGDGRLWVEDQFQVPTNRQLERVLQRAQNPDREERNVCHDYLVVSRGLAHPEPWAIHRSNLNDPNDWPVLNTNLKRILNCQPDYFITPVMAVYGVPDEQATKP
jgi:hypothetical protein